MNPELQSLISLQDVDLKIIERSKRFTTEIPQQIALLQDSLRAYETELNKTKEKFAAMQKERRKLEGEVEVARTKLSKYKEQLMEVKTNKEYTAVLKEIETCKSEIDKMEDRILEFMEQADQIEQEVKRKENELKLQRERILSQQKELENAIEVIRKEIEQLTADKDAIESTISRDLLDMYKRVASQKKGIALAEAKAESCQVCHVRLRPQVFNDVKRNTSIITCESCGRILYWAAESVEKSKQEA